MGETPRTFLSAIRAPDWWEHKLPPLLGTGYAAAYLLNVSLWGLGPTFLLLLVALVPGAAFVGLVNDLTDIEVDRRAGRPPGLVNRSRRTALMMLIGSLGAGCAVGLLAWRTDVPALTVYAAAWLAFACYSVPPLRLKTRGTAGLVTDALGSGVLPQLLAALVVFGAVGRPLDTWWLVTLGVWAFAYGMRAILWHQLVDARLDRRSGARTFATEHGDGARRLSAYVLFPVEVASFIVVLAGARNPAAVALLAPYALAEITRARWSGTGVGVISAARGVRMAMHEFYVVLYPLVFLVAGSVRDPRAALVLVAHLVLFPRRPWWLLIELWGVARTGLRVVSARTPAERA